MVATAAFNFVKNAVITAANWVVDTVKTAANFIAEAAKSIGDFVVNTVGPFIVNTVVSALKAIGCGIWEGLLMIAIAALKIAQGVLEV